VIAALLAGLAFGAGGYADDATAVVEELAGIEAHPGTATWDRAVAFHLLVAYDQNRSGTIDRTREVKAMPCGVLTTLDSTLARESQYPGLLATYGFDKDLIWLGGYLGFHKRVRGVAHRHMEACGITSEGPQTAIAVDHEVGEVISGMLSVLPDAGSPEWTAHTRMILLRTYDLDGSDWIDTAMELRSVSCTVWHTLEDLLFESEGEGVVEGFRLRSLGISDVLAVDVRETARRCGLRDVGR
jgi:hypothetical protein